MKITVIGPYPPFRGGVSDFNSSLCKELTDNHNLQLINFTTQYPKILFPGKTQYKSDYKNDIPSERVLSSINPISWSKTAKDIIAFNPELIIIQYWMPFFTFSFNSILKKVKKGTNAKVVAICHNLTPHEDKGFYKYFTKRFLGIVDRFIVMSDSVKFDLLKFVPNANHKTLFHPIYDLFGQGIDKNIARKNLGIKPKNVILFFGLIRKYKGLDILLQSIPLLKEKLTDFKVVIAGESYENPKKYYEIIDKLDIDKFLDIKMEFIPEKDVVNYFSATDVVVLPYKTATQSGIAQIAYNFNRPVILSNVGGLSEIVIDGKTGYVVNSQPDEFAKAISNYFNNNKFKEFSQNIKEHKNKYSWENFTNQLLEFSAK